MLTQGALGMVFVMLLSSSIADTRVSEAAQKGDILAIQSLISEKADVNAPQSDGTTAVHWAAYHDDLDMARLLLQAGADVKATTRLGGMTPLHLAAVNGAAPMIEMLLNSRADANATNANGTTPLMLAAASGDVAAIKALVDRGADVNARDVTNGQTAVMFAAALNRAPAIQLLAQSGADLSVTTKISESKPNASDRQVRAGGEQNKAAQVGGNTALHFAAREGHMEAVQVLLAAGAEVNQVSTNDAMSPLVQAAINGQFEVARFLLENGADPNLATTKAGVTPLWAVIDARYAPRAWYPSPNVEQKATSHLELIELLLAKGANPNARLIEKPWFRTFGDSNQPEPAGATAFYRAAQANDVPAMKLLIAAGANPTIPTKGGTTPLLVAGGMQQDFQGANFVPEARLDTIRYLVETLGVDVNAKDNRGYSPLHAAAFLGRNDIIAFLIAHGADVTARANQISNGPSTQAAKPGKGDTVADMANGWTEKTLQFPETVQLLLGLGSEFSDTCWASVCVNPTRTDRKQQ